ncbi:MAG: tRNA preQ1(34) S-adenosylmethionine ribosyltransferase-isomerase QueA [Candidatus Saccharibacteria bacterium]
MNVSDYDYNLPQDLVAIEPPIKRGGSKLLCLSLQNNIFQDKFYVDLADHFEEGDTIVLNDTRVIKARLKVKKESGVEREIVVLEKHSFDDDWHRHKIMYRKKINVGEKLFVGDATLIVEGIEGDGLAIIRSNRDLLSLTDAYGEVPLPPYMHRDAKPLDIERYQTIWAKDRGSVAAPTASLNMTAEILSSLRDKGVNIVYLTLHVGLGTFLPIRSDRLEEHHMHKEFFVIPKDTISRIQSTKKSGKKVIAIGTTVARTLEYANKFIIQPAKDISGEADIFIYPGYKFKSIDGLLTNFHAPKSTVLMLTAAFVGWDKLLSAYNHAVDKKYNFLSYGDSMLII